MPRILATALVASVLACAPGGGDPDGGQEPCAKQTDCSTEYTRVCISGRCTRPLEDPTPVSVNAYMANVLRSIGSYRSFVFHGTTPSGGTVKCVSSTGQLQGREAFSGDVSKPADVAAYNATLFDPARFNLTAFPAESNQVPASGDTYVIPVLLDGGPRTIYLEFYGRQLSAGTPGGEGLPVASLCIDGVVREDPAGGGIQNVGGTTQEW